MTTINSASDHGSVADSADLPRPEVGSSAPSMAGVALPRPVSATNVADNGRIRFGSGFRLPITR